ncbi:MAG: formylglycine-generating enzyme family protein [Planctomycetota bacterium]
MRYSYFGIGFFFFFFLNAQEEISGFRYLRHNEQGYPLYEHTGFADKKATSLVFVLLPGGTFEMGSTGSDPLRYPDELYHQIHLSDRFLMAETELTQKIWTQVMETTPWKNQKGQEFVKEGEDLPAVYLSWEDCQQFCERTGLQLPTEEMWEYSCRANAKTPFYWGLQVHNDYLWYQENTWKKDEKWAHPVKQKKPNAFGLYDMLGNVWEWCQDIYQPYQLQPNKEKKTDPPATAESFRVNRGGAFLLEAQDCRSSVRNYVSQNRKGFALGVRFTYLLPK